MTEYARDEFGRSRNGNANSKAEPSSSYRSQDSRPQTNHSSNRSDQRGQDGPYYGPGSYEQVDKNLCPGIVIQGEVTRIESYGAFVSFRDRLQRHHKGLLHISQLANHRTENVTDVLKMNQTLYVVILEVEEDQRMGKRIRLSLKDVDQSTGKYTGRNLTNDSKGGRRASPKELEARAKSRRETLHNLNRHWKVVEGNPSSTENGVKNNRNTTDIYLRKLYSSSPLRPSKQDDEPKPQKGSRKGAKPTDSSLDGSSRSSSSGSSSDSSSSESYESDRRSRHRGGRRRRNNNSRSRRDGRKRKRSSKSRSRRRRSPSTSSSSSDSSSSSGSSSNSSNGSGSGRQHDKIIKLDGDIDKDEAEAKDLIDLNNSDFKEAEAFKKAVQGVNDEEEEEEGPMPLQQAGTSGGAAADGGASYGKALLPGEGQALAQYVQQNLRIPRRGEIGFAADDIDHWENSGYVMSGSRHTRMNAVRIRKENQVYSAEEQRALALLTMEENQQKEAQLMEDFRAMLKEKKKLRDQGK